MSHIEVINALPAMSLWSLSPLGFRWCLHKSVLDTLFYTLSSNRLLVIDTTTFCANLCLTILNRLHAENGYTEKCQYCSFNYKCEYNYHHHYYQKPIKRRSDWLSGYDRISICRVTKWLNPYTCYAMQGCGLQALSRFHTRKCGFTGNYETRSPSIRWS